ncbi:hypothetical protein VTO73DRAFT_5661 [Trametes versicolor]
MGMVVLDTEPSHPEPISTFPDNVDLDLPPGLLHQIHSIAHTEAVPLGDSLQAPPLPTNSLAQKALPIVSPSSQPRGVYGKREQPRREDHLTGIIPHSPTSQAALNAASELVLVSPVGKHHCNFVQPMADRTVDMRRHVNAHFASPSNKKTYFCTGRPVDDFPQEISEVIPENLQEIRADRDVNFVGQP